MNNKERKLRKGKRVKRSNPVGKPNGIAKAMLNLFKSKRMMKDKANKRRLEDKYKHVELRNLSE